MARWLWLVPPAALGAALLWRRRRHRAGGQGTAMPRIVSWLGARCYDAVLGTAVEPFYAGVAREMAALRPIGVALDVGCGPGRLALHLARAIPDLEVIGLDVSPEMVELAARRAAAAGLAGRVRFQVGDAAALPFDEGQFDLVVSSFSLHHWADPAGGLAEMLRVVKSGGWACVYDLADWLLRATRHGRGIADAVAATSLAGEPVETVGTLGPLPFLARLCLPGTRRPGESSVARGAGARPAQR